MLSYPNFPTESATGQFPSIPIWKIQIWNIFDLLGLGQWFGQLTGYYSQYLTWETTHWATGLPPPTPPTPPNGLVISFNIPNLLGLPQWLAQALWWGVGWAGALFKYFTIYILTALGNIVLYLVNGIAGIFTTTLNYTRQQTAGLGIFSIPIEIFVAGVMLLLMIGLIFGIVKLGQSIIEAI